MRTHMLDSLVISLAIFALGLGVAASVALAAWLRHRWRLARVRRALARHSADARRLLAIRPPRSARPLDAEPAAAALRPVRPIDGRVVHLQRRGDSRPGAEVKR